LQVACFGPTCHDAFLKAMMSTGMKLPKKNILVSIQEKERNDAMVATLTKLDKLGYKLFGTEMTAAFFQKVRCIPLHTVTSRCIPLHPVTSCYIPLHPPSSRRCATALATASLVTAPRKCLPPRKHPCNRRCINAPRRHYPPW
jgi:hypothetical protein